MAINLLRYAQGENVSDTLSASIGSTDTSIPVNTISKWSSNGGNVIIDRGTSSQEIIVVTGVSGSSLVVASGGRGFDGTTAVGHNSGTTIESVPFAKDWNDLVSALLNLLVIAGTLDTTKVVDLTTAQTLTNKTLTSPKVGTALNDTNGNPTIVPTATASAVNGVGVVNGATGTGPTIKPDGSSSDTNADLILQGKGTGKVKVNAHYGVLTSDTDGSTITFDASVSNKHTVTLGGNRTLAISNDTAGEVLLIDLVQDATGSRTVTWWSGIKWAGGSAPTLTTTASKADTLGIRVITAGSAYYGYVVGQNL